MYKIEMSSSKNIEKVLAHAGRLDLLEENEILERLKKVNRPSFYIYKEGMLAGFAIISQKFDVGKLEYIYVFKEWRRKGFANYLMRIIMNIASDELANMRYVYCRVPLKLLTVRLNKLLFKYKFNITAIRPNRDIIYTYEKPVQECN